ncbi:hypothetical protein INT45_012668 [Circinella minor]|uniref:Uncharacterized protein n=1 Tax=Circinella minor TaxID=1195481 RepID=A0A8H7S210_9FUNG|nr:hypothetical protein INT45_012668 [Circinella minor]
MTDLEANVKILLKDKNQTFQQFIDSNIDFIAEHTTIGEDFKKKWEQLYKKVASELNIPVQKNRKLPSWKDVALRICNLAILTENSDCSISSLQSSSSARNSANQRVSTSIPLPSTSIDQRASTIQTPSHQSSSCSTPSTSLVAELNVQDKTNFTTIFEHLDKETFWKIPVKRQGEEENMIVIDQKIIEFAYKCNYHQYVEKFIGFSVYITGEADPSQSLILDIGDDNWKAVFSESELEDIDNFGDSLLPPIPSDMDKILNDIAKLNSPLEAYKYARSLEHDPIKEPLKAWIVVEILRASNLFLNGDDIFNSQMLEAELFYEVWGFIKNVARRSQISTNGSEGGSKSNADAMNKKRCISAIDPAPRRQMGDKIDTIFYANRKELGLIEVGKKVDQTKEMKDGLVKMPIVMHDMLINLATSKELLRKVKVVGYVINGKGYKISIAVMDSPGGFVSRIRRSNGLEYPSCSEDFIRRIVPLLRMTLAGFTMMLQTRDALVSTASNIQSLKASDSWKLPPTFIPYSPPQKNSTSKRQKTDN